MKKTALLIVLLGVTFSLSAQTQPKKDLKVGLVLSGGGAKGFAHIGVLKAIEEAGVEIDYIGGTSMGAIVGSLYASGYSIRDIEKIAMEFGFENYLSEEINRKDMPFYLKEIDDKYMIRLPVKNNAITLPSGWTRGQNVMNQFSKYTQHITQITDFKKLPIPFLCMATDLETGKQVILNSGDLAQAVRASAAYPTVVKPIDIDGKLLVDGGIVNNFPVEEVRNMGADKIIGVEVSSNVLYTKKDLGSVSNIIEQLVSYQMVNKESANKKNLTDIYINPLDESRFTTFSFEKATEIIQFGYDTALQQIDALKALAKEQNRPLKNEDRIVVLDRFIVKGVEFHGNTYYKYPYLIEKLQIKVGSIISFDDLFNGINRLWSTNNFTQILHKVELDGAEGKIVIDLIESDIKSHVQLGLHYDDLFQAGVLLNWTGKHLLFGSDYLSADAVVGKNLRYNLNYFIDNGNQLSLGLQSTMQHFEFDTDFVENFTSFDPMLNYKTLDYLNFKNRLNFQFVYHDNLALGFGVEHTYMNTDDETPLSLTKVVENTHWFNSYAYIKYDTYDNRMFPTRGVLYEANGWWYVGSKNSVIETKPFMQGKVTLGYATPLLKKLILHVHTEAGLSLTENTNPFLDFHLGGINENQLSNFIPLYGYPFAAMGDNSYLKSAVTLRYEWRKNHMIGFTGNIAKTDANYLERYDFFDHVKTGYGVFYGVNSIAGPIQITYARSPQLKNNLFSVKLGYWF